MSMTTETALTTETGTGEMKPGGRVVRFDEMAQVVTDRVDNPAEAGVERYVGLEQLDPESLKIRRWGAPTDVEAQKLRFQPGDIIFGKRRAYQRKVAVADFEGICSAHAMVLRAREENVIKEFLPFFMQSDTFFDRALAISVGSLSPTINWKTLASQKFALPPKDEQRRIADILWAADEAIQKAADVVNSTNDLITIIKTESFGISEQETHTLKELCEPKGIKIGPFGSQLHASDYVSDGIPVIMPSDMKNDFLSEEAIARITPEMADRLSLHKVLPGDILLPRRGELDRRAFTTPEQSGWICGTGSIRVRIKSSIPSLAVFYALSTSQVVEWLRDHAVGTTMPNLNATIVSNIPIKLPETENIGSLLNTIEAANSALQAATARHESLLNLKKQLHNNLFGDSNVQ